MGQPVWGNAQTSLNKGGALGELKHLSTPRRRNQVEIPLVVASERGVAQTFMTKWQASLSYGGVERRSMARWPSGRGVTNRAFSRTSLEGETAGGESPVGERGEASTSDLE